MTDEPSARPLAPLLLIGLLTVPMVFGWLLLRQGYSRSLRLTVLIYALVMTTIPFVGRSFG